MSKYSDIKKVILENFPKCKIKYIKEFPEGYNNIAYGVRLDKGDYVIKIIELEGYETYVLKQNIIRKLVRSKFKNYPITKIIKSDYTKNIINKPYIISEKLTGESVQKSYKKINNKKEIFEEIGELYGKLHSFKMESYGELDSNFHLIKNYKSWYLKNCKRVKKIFDKLEEKKLLSPKTLRQNKNFFESVKQLLKKEVGPRLCHGDASLTNILAKKVGKRFVISGIIDFEFCRSSGIVNELFSGLRTPDRKLEHKEDLIRGYLKFNKLPKDWEKLVYLYKWISYLNRLSSIDGMKWRNLNEEQTIQRKKNLRKESLLNLKKIQKKI